MERPLLFGYYLTHRALRKDVERLKAITAKFESYRRDDWKKVIRWFNYHSQLVHHHHDGEDEYFFPLIKQRTARFAAGLQQMDDEHKALDRFEEKLNAQLTELVGGGLVATQDFNNLALAYGRLIISHLEAEEQLVQKAISEEFTREEVLEAEDRYTRMISPERRRLSLPWLADAMTTAERKMFFSALPFFVKWIYQWRARPHFEKLVSITGA